MTEISFLICGPIHHNGISGIPYYLSKGINVIYSTWEPTTPIDFELITKVYTLLPPQNIFVSKYMNVSAYDNTQNAYFQAKSWYAACKLCLTNYSLKIRSTIKFDNIDALIKSILEHPGKITSISPYFRSGTTGYPYCPSDFVIGTSTVEALAIITRLVKVLETTMEKGKPVEKKICAAVFSTRNIIQVPDYQQQKIQMIANYQIVDVNCLSPTLYYSGKGPFPFFTTTKDGWHASIANIEDY